VRRDGELKATDWDEALDRVVGILRGASGKAVASYRPVSRPRRWPQPTSPLRVHLERCFPGGHGEERRSPCADLALRAERAPNAKGASSSATHATSGVDRGGESAAVVLVLDDPDCAVATKRRADLSRHRTRRGCGVPACRGDSADANVAEEEGTFTNRDGREQPYYQAKPAARHGTAGGVGARAARDDAGPRGGVVSFFLIASAIKSRRLQPDHGWRGAADAVRAAGVRLDAGSSGPIASARKGCFSPPPTA